jgi:uroporphyrinogen-III decarboxylase
MCIAGDVPANLFSQGTPAEIESYCKKLIEKIGKDTGFILSTGCVLPTDCKSENFKTMVRTAKDYYPYARKPIKKIF